MSFEDLRKKMVENQLKKRGIEDEDLLKVMGEIPRELFLPKELSNLAYDDSPVPIGYGQTISQPYIVAKMTELLNVKRTDKILEIGTGSGYQTAILSKLGKVVFSIERINELKKFAEGNLKKLGITNVFLMTGDGTIGLSNYAPFDKIMVTAASPQIPKNFIDQLSDKGIMILPLGDISLQVLTKVTKNDDQIKIEKYDYCRFVPLLGKYGFFDNGV
ncbi:MAG: Protein-L-isoaspartate O-methyltransferase [candidate division TA06 bacterium 32_111]|uniref:Protein-L-isoaspartate O-methyltransferase n=2 Tax=Bacteria candidate phyla TaxID=1783234 RepID=A0A101I0F7_UNCT6|nr:MAG: Protein-L-isoaspartate O-methyltransferase [candidate division TA06 bacterium 32_111]KUK86747.1 MAG: Protein-L-isoaspartate O-methyltransferase [candidate division TA06 bacterium 34_109]HAF08283.1 protein-L-isoaspartate O-methyltransferase [candidate division WOR-3 bacterium]HCP16537.1 protein-L-isoaspartate O-methyltransferase [candidate division WOR-3 bacterium]